MSGLKNEPITGGKFLNFKDGAIISAVDGEKKSYTSIEGFITDLDITDEEYKGKEYRKITLFIIDEDEAVWKLGFPLESGYGNGFCSLAFNVDFNKPVKISGGTKEMENDKSYGMFFIKQPNQMGMVDGVRVWEEWKNLKWYYKKDSEGIPTGVVTKDRNGTYTDYTDRNNFFHEMLIEKIRPAIIKADNVRSGTPPKEAAAAPKQTTKSTPKKAADVKKK